MYAALLNEELVTAVAVFARDSQSIQEQNFVCPNCRKPVQLIVSGRSGPFFRHLNTRFRTAETPEHELGKKIIFTAARALGLAAKLEVPLANDQIRADVYIETLGQTYGVELQCAPLTTAEFNVRHNFYHDARISDVWLLGKRHFLHRKIKQIHLDLLRTNADWGSYLIEVDSFGHLFRLKYNIQQDDLSRNCRYQTQQFALDEQGLLALKQFRPRKLLNYRYDYVAGSNYLKQQVRQQTALGKQLSLLCYERGIPVLELAESELVGYRKPGKDVYLLARIAQKRVKK
ncbi:competence protein [Amylolactobacillus amylotrophicus DSM 20534]|uniref:Uncharacterized protein n=4 Tax=Amylolactobacillus TaxID=2767876 RepID=A0A1L6XD77_9LACO|nr:MULTISPECIES: competence protein CoiA family protein [Amylolactobacillus]APT18916.1 hypothetical protein LA20533_06490 [Amylolactobacillus amylophilus DSM 20533 = JCM 1125]KRK38828.1 competence protein [Amylolactobacillus amylotrophicus DSM 20534]KRM42529.1 competence protein [Amylolactobacillus amylophilus DSM 20533 = JCM 1125]GED80050.1 competence protein [Amylolactobacillus amylophilus]